MSDSRSTSVAAPAAWHHRPGLDGLRGLAVAAVVVFHLDERWLPGGFLGVDAFFTLSGFLITSLLLVEVEGHGRVRLGAFWARRARRLLPAALLLIVAMAALLPWLDPVERGRRVPELLASLGYVANWHFIRADLPYFDTFVDASPVRHLWSLAIEEQFYLAWPLVVAALARSRGALVAATTVGAAMSVAAMAILHDPASPTRAYFGTDARVHQILLGALAALALARWPVRPGRLPSAVGAASVLGLAWMAWTVDGATDWYYRGGSALAAAFTIGAIVGAEHVDGRFSRALAVGPLRGLGLVSYGLYLWHWPVIVLLGPDELGLQGVPLATAQVAVAMAITLASYHLLEVPIRRGTLGSWTLTPRRLARLVPFSLATVALLVLAAGVGRTGDPLSGQAGEVLVVGDRAPMPPASLPTDGGVESGAPDADGADAATADVRSVALVGDSVAYLWNGSLSNEAGRRGLQYIGAAVVSCFVGYEPLYKPNGERQDGYEAACADVVPAAHDTVRELEPDIVLWHDVNASYARRSPSGELLIDGAAWEEEALRAWEPALERLSGPSTTVVLVLPPWRSVDPPGCDGAARVDRCIQVQEQDERIRAATRAFVERHRASRRVALIDIDDLVCPAMPCPGVVDGVRLRSPDPDLTHFTGDGARYLAPHLFDRAFAAAEQLR
ncbi:MAG: acyltransferase family protein [Acidimicrobiales bacterium]